jgi:mono/diheme cytochrome c family protein
MTQALYYWRQTCMKLIRALMVAATVLFVGTLASAVMASSAPQQTPQSSGDKDKDSGGSGKGWTIPAGASQEQNPIASSPDVLAKGKTLFEKKCQRCHGKEGAGDGPDADADMPPGDLTDGSRAGRNPDGVMFYKVWNGRKSPKMPSFKTELSKEEVWTVVTYAKTLRKQS